MLDEVLLREAVNAIARILANLGPYPTPSVVCDALNDIGEIAHAAVAEVPEESPPKPPHMPTYTQRIALGLCPGCLNPYQGDYVHCADCREGLRMKRAARLRAQRREGARHGLQ
jgi:hypothetical protein